MTTSTRARAPAQWFDVDRTGLSRLLQQRGKSFAIYELLQNAFDTDATNITVAADKTQRRVHLTVTDDSSTGFVDLSHAFTLFAPSAKLSDPTKRGRFNLGEKLVLSICYEAHITTMTGSVFFSEDGTRKVRRGTQRSRGTEFCAQLKMTTDEFAEFERGIYLVHVPDGKRLVYNGDVILARAPLSTFEVALPTVVENEAGDMTRTMRKTVVNVHAADFGTPMLYEMGIPVVELLDDAYSVDVQQKVPQSLSRDNVPAAYLRTLRTHTLNEVAGALGVDEVNAPWVRDALDHPAIDEDAVDTVLTKRFGTKRVVYDPSDLEANARAASEGYTVIPSRALSRASWDNVRTYGLVKPAGQVTPSPKPFSPDGETLKMQQELTPEMIKFKDFARRLHDMLVGSSSVLSVSIANDFGWKFAACYNAASRTLIVNVASVSYGWFDRPTASMISLLLHEFAHATESNHLNAQFYKAIERMGGKLAMATHDNPKIMEYSA